MHRADTQGNEISLIFASVKEGRAFRVVMRTSASVGNESSVQCLRWHRLPRRNGRARHREFLSVKDTYLPSVGWTPIPFSCLRKTMDIGWKIVRHFMASNGTVGAHRIRKGRRIVLLAKKRRIGQPPLSDAVGAFRAGLSPPVSVAAATAYEAHPLRVTDFELDVSTKPATCAKLRVAGEPRCTHALLIPPNVPGIQGTARHPQVRSSRVDPSRLAGQHRKWKAAATGGVKVSRHPGRRSRARAC